MGSQIIDVQDPAPREEGSHTETGDRYNFLSILDESDSVAFSHLSTDLINELGFAEMGPQGGEDFIRGFEGLRVLHVHLFYLMVHRFPSVV